MKAIVILALLVLTGCEIQESKKDKDSQMLLDYTCSEEQLALVDIEYEICTKSGFFNSYCYASAKKTQCTKIQGVEIVKEGDK